MNTRRHFLKLCGLAGLGVSVPVRLRAQTDKSEPYLGPFYMVFNAAGGWDTTYLMDPKGTDGINRLYGEGDILTEGNIRFAPTAKHIQDGMSNEEFFAKYASELLVFNGLDYSVNNHAPCSRYVATGKLDSSAYPTFAALVAACRGPSCPLAFLTFGNYSATGNLVPMARIPYLPTLKKVAQADSPGGNHLYHDPFVLERIERTLKDQLDSRLARNQLPRHRRAQRMLYAAQTNSKALKRAVPHISDTAPQGRLPQQAEIALASFKAGICVSANLSIGQFDSHANNDRDQMKLIPELLAGIHFAVQRAEDLGIREQLVVVIQSEMGRTPHYNQGDGKDHWSIGSMMFLGRGIRGNRVLGKTDDGQFALPFNPKTLTAGQKPGIRVRPEHIHTALRQHAGILNHEFSRQFPLKVAPDEQLTGFWG
jgi:uncharacterized protein (DUF1501 family)